MTDQDIFTKLRDGKLTERKAIAELVKLGAAKDDAHFLVALQVGATTGDLIGPAEMKLVQIRKQVRAGKVSLAAAIEKVVRLGFKREDAELYMGYEFRRRKQAGKKAKP